MPCHSFVCVRVRSLSPPVVCVRTPGPPQGGWGVGVHPERKRCVALPLTRDYIVSFPNAEH
nr:MAG TPA: hypothetical protein [Caudoviricetes sp.]